MSNYCEKLGISLDSALLDQQPQKFVTCLNNGAVFEIIQFVKSKCLPKQQITTIIGNVTNTLDINHNACMAKIFRIQKKDKYKRGSIRDVFREENFLIPLSTDSFADRKQTPKEEETQPDDTCIIENLVGKLETRTTKISQLVEKNKRLKRKLERREVRIEKERENKNVKVEELVEKKLEKSSKDFLKKSILLKKSHYRIEQCVEDYKKKFKAMNIKCKCSELAMTAFRKQLESTKAEMIILQKENQSLKKDVKDSRISIVYLKSLLQDNKEINVYDADSNTYTPELIQCAMNLTNLKVPSKNVSPVIREVASLCGVLPNCLPSCQTVDDFCDRKMFIAEKQLGSVSSAEKDTG